LARAPNGTVLPPKILPVVKQKRQNEPLPNTNERGEKKILKEGQGPRRRRVGKTGRKKKEKENDLGGKTTYLLGKGEGVKKEQVLA